MPITKFDLYNAEWLDLVFDHRNKDYGAYELRQHYGRTMTRAMGLTFGGIAVLIAASIIFKPKPPTEFLFHPVVIPQQYVVPPPPPPVKAEQRKPDAPKPIEASKPAVAIQTTQFTKPVIVPTDPPVDPPVIKDIQGAVGPETTKGTTGIDNAINKTTPGTGGPGVPDTKVYDAGSGTLEVMPEPVGGSAAWAKFLQRNLRFPPVAQDQGVSGRVILSFIIERDGHLSNITVDRPAGYGFDEEALRVLKMAKAWKPGIQNGQAVRVKYSIPINFQLGEQ